MNLHTKKNGWSDEGPSLRPRGPAPKKTGGWMWVISYPSNAMRNVTSCGRLVGDGSLCLTGLAATSPRILGKPLDIIGTWTVENLA